MSAMLLQITILVLAGLMLAAAFFDASKFIIPNWLVGLVLLTFPIAALASGLGWSEAGNHLLGGLVALVIGFALFAPGWIGGGDAKLFAAAALWFGWPEIIAFLIHTVMAGGVLVLLLLALRWLAPRIPALAGKIEGTALAVKAPVPYGIAIAAGVFWSLPKTAFWQAF
ncbi:prepilin peptidase [uncultured Maricaulis sp.]|uniref:A24 family peptidase n=1 Tax=uncultured Maricaulis sp. TaxID=174710 RepID=UPI0025DDBF79|nr:prepilin peptidase [uncultured Maricaulis sp.]